MSNHRNTTAKVTLAKGPGKLTTKDGNAKTTMLSGSDRKVANEATAVLRGTTDKVTSDGK
jgi:hypothetical protein